MKNNAIINSPKTCVIYCRVSSAAQVDGTSLEMQERQCRDYAERNGMEILQVFIEKGESAKTADRTEFNKAVAYCCSSKNKVGFFIVYKVDRFMRNLDEHGIVRAALKRYNTELRSVTEPIDNTATGRLMEGVIASVAEFDNTIRADRSVGGMLEKLKKGVWVWQAPLGYYRPTRGANLALHPDNSRLIRLVFEEYAKGIHTYESLAEFAAERGLRTARGKMPTKQTMERIIKNRLYCGVIDVWGIQQKGSFDPIVDEELFNRCQEEYKRNSGAHAAPRISANPEFPLRRQVICEVCGIPLTASSPRGRQGKKYSYYHHYKQGCRQAKFIPSATLEQLFIKYLRNITPDARFEKLFKGIVMSVWKENYKGFGEASTKLRAEIGALEQDRLKIFDFHLAGKYTDEEFTQEKNRINEKINAKHVLLRENHVEEFNMEEVLDHAFRYIRNTSEVWQESKYPARIRFQRQIFKGKMPFDGKEFGNTELTLVYKLNKESAGKKSHLVPLTGFEPVFLP